MIFNVKITFFLSFCNGKLVNLQKYNLEVGTDGRVIEQTGKPLHVKDKYITNVFKGEQK